MWYDDSVVTLFLSVAFSFSDFTNSPLTRSTLLQNFGEDGRTYEI